MAQRFTRKNWKAILDELKRDPAAYGMPEGGREKSLVFASFNIRKLSSWRGRQPELDFLARFCACCDLVSIQEVQDNLDGLRHLMERTESHVAGRGHYALTVSDITGRAPGGKGMAERLAFLYRHHRVRRLDMASDLTYDRTSVLANIFEHDAAMKAAREKFEKQMARYKAGQRKTKPEFVPPKFISFVRTPYVAAFEAQAANDQEPLRLTAVNAHLVYGTMTERKQEFKALMKWLINRLKAGNRLVAPNFLLLGDLNLDFNKPRNDRPVIESFIRQYNGSKFNSVRRVYFPFLDKHPISGTYKRSNARATETFDQIAFLNGPKERHLPNDQWRSRITSSDPDEFDYGVFNFVRLFAQALNQKPYHQLTRAQKDSLHKMFEHSVSDHLPIWVRIPRPGFR